MYKQSPYRPPPREPLSLMDAWAFSIIRPTVETYQEIVNDFNISSGKAAVSLFISLVIGLAVIAFADMWLTTVGFGFRDRGLSFYVRRSVISLMIMLPLISGGIVLSLMTIAAVINWVAQKLGGRGTYTQLFYSFAAHLTPLTLIACIIGIIPIVRFADILIFFYGMVLNVIATKAVHHFSWAKAIISIAIAWTAVIIIILIFASQNGVG
jgi:hypothetical protein